MFIDLSSLSKLNVYMPTGKGKYLMRCGGVIELTHQEKYMWKNNNIDLEWSDLGYFIGGSGLKHPFDIVAPIETTTNISQEELDQLKLDLDKSTIDLHNITKERDELKKQLEKKETQDQKYKELDSLLKKYYPSLHPDYEPDMGDLTGWRFVEIGETIMAGDRHWGNDTFSDVSGAIGVKRDKYHLKIIRRLYPLV